MTALEQAREVRKVGPPSAPGYTIALRDWGDLHKNGLKASLGCGGYRTYVPISPNDGAPWQHGKMHG